MDERLKRLIARRGEAAKAREQIIAKRKAIVDLAEEESRSDLSTEEDAEHRALTGKVAEFDGDIAGLDERIAELAAEEERSAKVTEGAAAVRRAQARSVQVTEQATYLKGNGRSYIQDLSKLQLGMDGSGEARMRLERHATDVATMEEYRAGLNRTDSTGGYFVPPAWLVDQYVNLARSSRATADVVTNMALPSGTDSINIPKLSTGTTVAVQATDGAAVSETDAADAVITAPVIAVAGQETISQLLLDQSPINFDEVIFADLAAAYNTAVDVEVLNGSGSAGHVTGLLTTSAIIAVTYTDTAPSVVGIYAKLNDAVQRVHTQRYAAPSVIVMHPRRWAWFNAAFDTTNRPLVTPSGPGFNGVASFAAVASQQVVGNLLGLPVVTDPNLPTNLGAGTNQDPIIIMKADDCILWESSLRTRTLPEVLSGNLNVRVQVYGYLAFAVRQAKSIATVNGTGVIAPTF